MAAGQSDVPNHRIGLDIGSHTIKAVEVIEHASEITIRAAGSIDIWHPGPTERPSDRSNLHQSIASLWSSAGFQSKDVVLGLSSNDVYLKWLHMECSDDNELDGLAKSTAVRGVPFSADDAIADYRILSRVQKGSGYAYHVGLAAASAQAVNAAMDVVERAGLNLLAVDVGVSAALRSLETERSHGGTLWSGQPRAHCIVGASGTMVGVTREGALEFARTVPVGGNDLTQCIVEHVGMSFVDAEKLKVSPSSRLTEDGTLLVSHNGVDAQIPMATTIEKLSREIARSLRFFSSQFTEGSYLGMTGTTTLSGGLALLKGIDECLRLQGVEVTGAINPFAGYSVEAEGGGVNQIGAQSTVYTTAMGLAVWDHWDRVARLSLRVA
jgi:type IV pilus assembly protein PilM